MNPLSPTYVARRRIVEELVVLCGADQLNLVQYRKELEAMTLDELAAMRDKIFNDLDQRYQKL